MGILTGSYIRVAKRGRMIDSRGYSWPTGVGLLLLLGVLPGALIFLSGTEHPSSGKMEVPLYLPILTVVGLLLVVHFLVFGSWHFRADGSNGKLIYARRWGLITWEREAAFQDKPIFLISEHFSSHGGPSLHEAQLLFPTGSKWSFLRTVYASFRRENSLLFTDVVNALVGNEMEFEADAVREIHPQSLATVPEQQVTELLAQEDAAELRNRESAEFVRKVLARDKIIQAYWQRPGADRISEAMLLSEASGVSDPLRQLVFTAAREGKSMPVAETALLLEHEAASIRRLAMTALVLAASDGLSPEAEVLRKAATGSKDIAIRRQAKTALEWLANGERLR